MIESGRFTQLFFQLTSQCQCFVIAFLSLEPITERQMSFTKLLQGVRLLLPVSHRFGNFTRCLKVLQRLGEFALSPVDFAEAKQCISLYARDVEIWISFCNLPRLVEVLKSVRKIVQGDMNSADMGQHICFGALFL